MKSTLFVVTLAALVGCQRGEAEQPERASKPVPTAAVAPANVTSDYTGDIEKLCDVIRLSGAPDDDAQTLTTANWLAANLATADSRKFLISIQPLVGAAKADALDAEAKRVGLAGCALAAVWRKPNAAGPM